LTDWGRRDLHRDVRVALLRALWGHLDRDEAWAVLAEAARSPDVAIASVAMRVPSQRLTSGGQRRLAGLLAHLLRHPDRKLRLQTLQHCAAHPVGDPDRAILPALLEAMGSPVNVESAAAARAVFTTYGGEATGAIAGAVYGLLPNRRALKTAVEALRDAAALSPSRVLPTVRAVLDVLAPDRLTAALRARIAMAALPASELAPFLRSLASGDHLDGGVLAAIVSAVPRRRASAPSDWEDLEAALAGEPDERLRRVALAALVTAGRIVGGWTDARKTRLANYQGDPSPLVAAPAQFTFVSGDVDMMDLEIWDDWTELM
jgi:hypothetical protein